MRPWVGLETVAAQEERPAGGYSLVGSTKRHGGGGEGGE